MSTDRVLTKLTGISVVGLFACFGAAHLFSSKLSDMIKNSLLYKEAIEIVRKHKGAVHLLGEPIEDSSPALNNSTMFFNGMTEFTAHLKGPKSSGKLFVTAIGEDIPSLELDTIQLQLGKDSSKRLIIKEPKQRILSDSSEKK